MKPDQTQFLKTESARISWSRPRITSNFFLRPPYKFTLHENNNGGTPVTQDTDAHILNANM